MAATASQPKTNGTNSNIRPPINSTALSKIVNLPLVNYPLTFAYNVVEGHAILARPYVSTRNRSRSLVTILISIVAR